MSLASVPLNIILPTTRADGSPLPASEIASVTVLKGLAADSVTAPIANIPASQSVLNVQVETTVDTYFRAVAVDTENRESVPGVILVVQAVPIAPPAAPSLSL